MRIQDLFENTNFDETEYIDKKEGTIDYDLAEDLAFFMNNNDDVYRRSVFPAVTKCVEAFKNKKSVKPSVFKQSALESYRAYKDQYPIRSLPDDLDEELCNEVCEKMYKEVQESLAEKKLKD